MKYYMLILITLLLAACTVISKNPIPKQSTIQTIRITGKGVKRPQRYDWNKGMTLSELIIQAGSFSSPFASRKIRLFRTPGGFDDLKDDYKITHATVRDTSGMGNLNPIEGNDKGERLDCITVSLSRINSGRSADILLKPNDWIATLEFYE